jgi:hypothetical protein
MKGDRQMNARRCCVVLVLLAMPLAARAGTPETGLYQLNEGDNGQLVQRGDTAAGGEIRLGDLISEKLSEASLVSGANDNSLFRLSLKAGPIPEGADQGRLAVVVGDLYLPVYGHSDRRENGAIDIDTQVAGLEAARKVAKSLGIEPQLRKHLGHELLVTVEPKQASYRPGEAVTLVMTIKNVGETSVSFFDGGQQRGPRNNQFSFIAFSNAGFGRALPDTGDPTNFGGPAGIKKLGPGDVFTKEVLLTNWFRFSKPGGYQITAIYQLGLLDDGSRIIWDDFAVARCFVRITAAEATEDPTATSPTETMTPNDGQ